METFKQTDYWVFDLDNTIYPRQCDLFAQIDVLMTGYVSNLTGLDRVEARKLQKELYRDYGTTLRGLMETRDIDPHDFLNIVHDIDYSPLPRSRELGDMIAKLPGRKLIYTNGSVRHAESTLKAMDISPEIFDGIFDIVASNFEPKPHEAPFQVFVDQFAIKPASASMFEDLPRNLETAKAFGMTTVLIAPQLGEGAKVESWEKSDDAFDFVDHRVDDLQNFLPAVLEIITN